LNVIKFKRDTSFRNDLFTPESFAHPAKMDSQLLIWIVEKYTKPGETILDPMFGSGTAMLACMLGRNVIGIELEQKFVDMAKANWEKVRQRPQLGSTMGNCQILQGDARNLEGLLADKCVFSPPFAGSRIESDPDNKTERYGHYEHGGLKQEIPTSEGQIANLPYGQVDKIVTSPPYAEALDRDEHRVQDGRVSAMMDYSYTNTKQGKSDGQISQLPYGSIDSVITSPPYSDAQVPPHTAEGEARRLEIARQRGVSPDKVSYMDYTKKVDAVVTSPPYEGSLIGSDNPKYDTEEYRERMAKLPSGDYSTPGRARAIRRHESGYSINEENIGNLKSTSYLSAMLQVYQQCFCVLRPDGLMILITKNFIREQKEIRLDLDTIRLCEQAGFTFKERWYRELPAQSFWRIIYKKRYPTAPTLNFEDILVFGKARGY